MFDTLEIETNFTSTMFEIHLKSMVWSSRSHNAKCKFIWSAQSMLKIECNDYSDNKNVRKRLSKNISMKDIHQIMAKKTKSEYQNNTTNKNIQCQIYEIL